MNSDRTEAQGAAMLCPDCSKPLQVRHECVRHEFELEVDVCARCDGIWFDHGEIEVFRRVAADAIERGTTAHFVRQLGLGSCPRCTTATLELGKAADRRAGECSSCHGVWIGPPPVDEPGTAAVLGSATADGLMQLLFAILS